MSFNAPVYGADDMWSDAAGETEKAQHEAGMAYAMARTASLTDVLYGASSEADLDNRLALITPKLAAIAEESGVDAEELASTHRRQALLAIEATQTKEAAPHGASDSCDANHTFHEMYGTLTRPQLAAYRKHNISPSDHDSLVDEYGEHGHKAIIGDIKKQTANGGMFSSFDIGGGRYASLQSPLERIAAIKQALEDGQNPLAWIPSIDGGQGQAEQPSMSGNEAFNEGDYVTAESEGDQQHVASGGNGYEVGTPAWFDQEHKIKTAPADPGEAEKQRLFPNGIPLRGDLTPEQEAWLKKRSTLAPKA